MALAAASGHVYFWWFTLRWPIWLLFEQPHLDYAFVSGYTREGQAAYLGSFLLLFGLQYAAYWLVRKRPETGPLWIVIGGQVLFGLLNVAIYPIVALDVYDYLMYGRIVLVYGGNPFTQPPAAFPDPLVGYSPWPREPSVYGPVWQMISLLPTAIAGDDLLVGLVAFKLVALGFAIGCSAVIWRLLSRVDPSLAPAGTLLFAWNPLLVFEIAGNAHNDAAMVFFVLLAVMALVGRPKILAIPLLGVAVLTKLLAIVLGPVFLAGLVLARGSWAERLVWIIGGGTGAILLTLAAYAPFWEGVQTLHFLTRGNWFTASFPTMLREYLRRQMEFEEAGRQAATMVGLLFAAFLVARLAILWREVRQLGASPAAWRPWLSAAHDATFAYLAFACIWWEPWYLTWLVALAALLPSRTVHDRALLFCYGGVVNYVVFKYIWPVYQPMTYTEIMGISVVAIFGLPLLHLAISSLWTTGRQRARRTDSVASTAV